ncbi:DMT family transporter [Bacillus timonensis]|uniref:DMT family transporter n=1 Tax=Bacillus timonensis TaxID=1033734 RepID=A0A4S3PW76_9BACI|nr:DMT family transporter [Bacillus timonensis]THE13252.1 DMT family transporter [Bacillus timonensis]
MQKQFLYGILLFVMMAWGLNIVAIKILVQNFPPFTITGLRILAAGLVIFVFLYVKKDLQKMNPHEFGYVALSALTGILGHQALLSIGLVNTSATNGASILALIPLVTNLLAVLFLKARMTFLKICGVLFGMIGIYFILVLGGGSFTELSNGDLFVFLSVIAQALSFIFIRKASYTLNPKTITCYALLMGAGFLVMLSFAVEGQSIHQIGAAPSYVWWVFIASAIISTGIGNLCYNFAISQLGAGETAIFLNLSPFFSLVGSVLFLNEAFKWIQLVGFILIVIGVLLGTELFERKPRVERQVGVSVSK